MKKKICVIFGGESSEYEISLNGNDEEIAYEHFIKLLKEIELL